MNALDWMRVAIRSRSENPVVAAAFWNANDIDPDSAAV